MELDRRIILYGNSLILGTLATSLRRNPQFEVTVLSPPLPKTPELESLKPDVVLFDTASTPTEPVFSLLERCPRLLLVGISPDKNEVQMWAGLQLKELSTQGLLKIIDQQLKDSIVT
jgi:hypothetical protein